MITLILSPDWNHYLWVLDGSAFDDSQLNLSVALRAQLDSYSRLHAELYFEGDCRPQPEDLDILEEAGVAAWRQLRKELGSTYDVQFYSHKFRERFATPEEWHGAWMAAQ